MSQLAPWAICLEKYFGFPQLRGRQESIIQRTLEGRHSLVIMPTGGGKSLCYQLPALYHYEPFISQPLVPSNPLSVVLSPLIALMKDQVDTLVRRGASATFVNSSLTRNEREERYASIREGAYGLLFVTPERFRKEEFLQAISGRSIQLLAVDEAHCISEWGHDFRPDYTRVREIRERLGNPPTIALTATATREVQQDIIRQLGLTADSCKLFHHGTARPNLALRVEEVWGQDEKVRVIQDSLKRWDETEGNRIIYFTLIRTLVEFSQIFNQMGIQHLCYHGDLERHQRRRVQEQFMDQNRQLVLATNAFGMGIDKENIRLVLHAEIPGSMESYFQEIGRAGRDGLPAECTLCYDQSDLRTQMDFLYWSNPGADFCQRVYQHLLHDAEQVQAFGMEWLQKQLCDRQHHDRRLETAIALLERYDVIEWDETLQAWQVRSPLPEALTDQASREDKLLRDQKKLYALVEYARAEGRYAEFIEDYFGE